MSGEGVQTDPDKIAKVRDWPVPANADELRSFLYFAGYYRRFVKDFSKLVRPLAELLPPTSTKKDYRKKPPDIPWKWGPEQQTVFERVKEILCSPSVLAYPNFSLPFELHTDASTKALGAVLYQTQDGMKRVIAYASRALTKPERKYSAYRLEFLALKWAVTEKFADYLAVNHFTVLTDNNPLTYVLTSAKLDTAGQRWAADLGHFNFDILYRSGVKNKDADGMSRYPYERVGDSVVIGDDTVKAICAAMLPIPLLLTLPCSSINLVEILDDSEQVLAQKEVTEIRKMQRQDSFVDRWRRAVIDNIIPRGKLNGPDLTMRRQFQHFFMKR